MSWAPGQGTKHCGTDIRGVPGGRAPTEILFWVTRSGTEWLAHCGEAALQRFSLPSLRPSAWSANHVPILWLTSSTTTVAALQHCPGKLRADVILSPPTYLDHKAPRRIQVNSLILSSYSVPTASKLGLHVLARTVPTPSSRIAKNNDHVRTGICGTLRLAIILLRAYSQPYCSLIYVSSHNVAYLMLHSSMGRSIRGSWRPVLGWVRGHCVPCEHLRRNMRAAGRYNMGRMRTSTCMLKLDIRRRKPQVHVTSSRPIR